MCIPRFLILRRQWLRHKHLRHFRSVSVCSARSQVMLYPMLLILRGRGDTLGFKELHGDNGPTTMPERGDIR